MVVIGEYNGCEKGSNQIDLRPALSRNDRFSVIHVGSSIFTKSALITGIYTTSARSTIKLILNFSFMVCLRKSVDDGTMPPFTLSL